METIDNYKFYANQFSQGQFEEEKVYKVGKLHSCEQILIAIEDNLDWDGGAIKEQVEKYIQSVQDYSSEHEYKSNSIIQKYLEGEISGASAFAEGISAEADRLDCMALGHLLVIDLNNSLVDELGSGRTIDVTFFTDKYSENPERYFGVQ